MILISSIYPFLTILQQYVQNFDCACLSVVACASIMAYFAYLFTCPITVSPLFIGVFVCLYSLFYTEIYPLMVDKTLKLWYYYSHRNGVCFVGEI